MANSPSTHRRTCSHDSQNMDVEALRRATCNLVTTLFNTLSSYISTYRQDPGRHSNLELRTIQMQIVTSLQGLIPILRALVKTEARHSAPSIFSRDSDSSSPLADEQDGWIDYYGYLLDQVRMMQNWWKTYQHERRVQLLIWSQDAAPVYKQRSINKATLTDMVSHICLIEPPSPPPSQTSFDQKLTDARSGRRRSSVTNCKDRA